MSFEKEIYEIEQEINAILKFLDNNIRHGTVDERQDFISHLNRVAAYRDLLVSRQIARNMLSDNYDS